MTLIISVATPKLIVQASDRRLTRKDNGNIVMVEDEENMGTMSVRVVLAL